MGMINIIKNIYIVLSGNNYKDWKAGKKVWKAPHVIRYWESITDENQHYLGYKCARILAITLGIAGFLYGLLIGHWLL